MSENTTTPGQQSAANALSATINAPLKKAVKKTATKKATKTAPAKKAAKKGAKTETKPREKKDGLRKPQLRILAALAKRDNLTRAQIAEKAPVDVATCVEYIGSHDDAIRLANDEKHFPSLLTLGLVKAKQVDVEGRNVIQYSITAKGRTAVAK